jgi:hypothetical protein
MGLFDFFKRKSDTNNKNVPEKPPVEPNDQGEYNLKLSDFSEKIHSAEVLKDAWINPIPDPEFEKAIAGLTIGPPMKKGDIIELKTYMVNVVLWGQVVDVTFDPDTAAKNLDDLIQKINKQLSWLTKNKDLVDEIIIRDLLPLKNENWLEDQAPISKEDFLQAIRPNSIDFIRNAALDLYYDDGDLFFGHTIKVSISAKPEVKKATMEG